METESPLAVASMFAVGLGIVVTVLFPFLIPGIAIVALLALPILPVALLAAIVAGVFVAGRGLARRIGGYRTALSRSRESATRRGAPPPRSTRAARVPTERTTPGSQ